MSRIIELTVKDFKRVREVHIEAQPHVNTIGGRNAQGKTSVLDAIACALGGKKLMPSEPIRAGSEKSEIEVTLDDLIVKRITTAKTDRLVVTNKEGDLKRGPQDLLDSLWGAHTIDPAAFLRMSPREQVDTIKRVLGLDFSEQDAKRKELYDERTAVNRTVKTLEGQLAGLPEHKNAPAEEVSVRELAAKVEAAREHNRKYDDLVREHEQARQGWKAAKADADRLRVALDEAETRMASHETRGKDVSALVDAFQVHPIEQYESELDGAEESNRKVRENSRRAEVAAELKGSIKDSGVLTDQIDAIDAAKREAIANAEFPLPNVAFDDTGLRLNDVPFEQASSAEKWRMSVAMGLAMHPGINVLLVREGEKLDADSRALLAQMAEEQDAQLWIEDCRAADGDATVIIEDGQIKEADHAE